jgi:NTE family protein
MSAPLDQPIPDQGSSSASAPRRDQRLAVLADAIARDYKIIALILQGGGALGAYQAGVYQGLHEASLRPSWFAGISIGAVNAALLAGNAPEHRLERLDRFWSTACEPSVVPLPFDLERWANLVPGGQELRTYANMFSAVQAMVQGQAGFFTPNALPPWLNPPGSAGATSFYDTSPLRRTLETLVDFDRINSTGVRFSVGAVNVRNGNFVYFDNAKMRIRPEHVMASAALPPGFPAIEIDGELYWDGGLVSNTPLEFVLDGKPERDTLAFQVDLWSARGRLPQDMADVMQRQKDIQYSSRTRRGTDAIRERQQVRCALMALLEKLPAELQHEPSVKMLRDISTSAVFDIVHLIYQSKVYEGQSKDYEFGITSMREHWAAGLADIQRTLAHPDYFERPSPRVGVATHDIHREAPSV